MISTKQQYSQKQTHTLSQSMIQACSVLAMGLDELSEFIRDAADENPLISFDSVPRLATCAGSLPVDISARVGIDFADELNCVRNAFSGHSELRDFLLLQIPAGTEDREYAIIRYVIDSLDPDGYFRDSVEETASRINCSSQEIESALAVIWRMDPAGIGARDLRQSLMLQLERSYPADKLSYYILRDYFHELSRNRVETISGALRCKLSEVYDAIENIRRLNCRPTAEFSAETAKYIIPDITVSGQDDNFHLSLNREMTLDIKIDESYTTGLDMSADPAAQLWLRDMKRQASMVRLFVQKRNTTLLLVCNEIFKAQKAFFFKGPEYLRPLRQRDIACSLSCHESTVFRAVRNKYLSCTWGTYPLSYFFSNLSDGIDDADIGNPKRMLRLIIEREDKSAHR